MVLAEAGKYPEAARMLERSIEMRPTQYRAWGLLASVYQQQHADAAKVRDTYLKAIALAADLRKQTSRDAYLLADVGSYYAAVGMDAESVPLLTAAAFAADVRRVLYQVGVG
jgi:Tfp pilus assembly protein PilF